MRISNWTFIYYLPEKKKVHVSKRQIDCVAASTSLQGWSERCRQFLFWIHTQHLLHMLLDPMFIVEQGDEEIPGDKGWQIYCVYIYIDSDIPLYLIKR